MKRLLTILMLLLWTVPSMGAGVSKGRIGGDGQTQAFNVDDDGRWISRQISLSECDATTGWSALNTDTSGIATDLDHVMGTNSIECDKVDGAANTVYGVVAIDLSSVNLETLVENSGILQFSLNVSATTDIDYCLLRLGTDSSNYNEWRVDDDDLAAGWNLIRFAVDRPSTAGNTGDGWDPSDIDHLAVGCAFDAQDDTLADLRVDHIVAYSGQMVSSEVGVAVGVGSSWTTLLTDIKTATEIVDDWDATHDSAVSSDGPQVMGSAKSSQETAVADGDAARLVVNLYGELVEAGYSWISDAKKMLEQDPVSEHHGSITLCDVTDYAETASPHTEYYYLDMDGYGDVAFQLSLDSDNGTVTATIECTVQDDGTAPASCTYEGVTNDVFGVASLVSAAAPATDLWVANNGALGACKYVRAKVVYATGNANDDGDATIWAKYLYR